MNTKQMKQTAKLINAAMLKLQDARDLITTTDDATLAEHAKACQEYHNLTTAISQLHYIMSGITA